MFSSFCILFSATYVCNPPLLSYTTLFRSPVQWRDLLQMVKATGYTAVSFYFFWGLHQTTPGGAFDFQGIKDVDLLLTMAAEEGLYVIARTGPYGYAAMPKSGLTAYITNRHAPLRSTDPENSSDA